MAPHILIIEDELGIALPISDRLISEGYQVVHKDHGLKGLEEALVTSFDLILLDLMLPGKNGLDVCRELRQAGIQTPILMLTAKDDLADKVVGLKLGADDYLTKPFELLELLARIEALLRRANQALAAPSAKMFQFGDVLVNLQNATVHKAGEQVPLSARLFQLLVYFLKNPDVLLTRDQLLDAVWGYDAAISTRTVDVHLAWLRQRLENHPAKPKHFITVYGMGYKFLN